MVVPIQLAQLPPITEMGLGTIRHANGRPEISRNHSSAIDLSVVSNTKRQSCHISSQARDSVDSDQMQDMRGVQASLYSYAAPQC